MAAGSAPGVDQKPYEVYHYGLDFAVRLLRQAYYAAEHSMWDVAKVLGPSMSLKCNHSFVRLNAHELRVALISIPIYSVLRNV